MTEFRDTTTAEAAVASTYFSELQEEIEKKGGTQEMDTFMCYLTGFLQALKWIERGRPSVQVRVLGPCAEDFEPPEIYVHEFYDEYVTICEEFGFYIAADFAGEIYFEKMKGDRNDPEFKQRTQNLFDFAEESREEEKDSG
jgi:hypothetical protein